MRKNKNRTLILSIASAAAVMPGCGDSSETNTSSDAATVMHPGGVVALPRDDASDEGTSVGMSGSFVAPADAGDEKPIMIGVMVDPRDGGPFPGVIIMPQDGSAKG